MSELATVGALIAAGLIVAWILSIRFHSESRTLESAIRLPLNATWALIGVFTILGGYYRAGIVIFIAGTYFFFANTRRVRDGELSMNPSGWRRKAGNWNPYNRSK